MVKDTYMKTLSEWLKEKEKTLRLSHKEVAEKLGIKSNTYSMYKSPDGLRIPKKETIRRFSISLGLDVEEEYKNWNFSDVLFPEEVEVISGHLLGDGNLHKRTPTCNTVFRIERCLRDEDYLKWSSKKLIRILNKGGICYHIHKNKKTNKEYKSCSFRTKYDECLNPILEKWYPKGIKIVPDDLQITPLILAIWIADDGCIRKNTSNKSFVLNIATNGFSKKYVVFLVRLLREKYGDKVFYTKSYRRRNEYMINVWNKDTLRTIFKDIDDYFPLNRKRMMWKTNDFDIDNLNKRVYPVCIRCKSSNTRSCGNDGYKPTFYCKSCNHRFYETYTNNPKRL